VQAPSASALTAVVTTAINANNGRWLGRWLLTKNPISLEKERAHAMQIERRGLPRNEPQNREEFCGYRRDTGRGGHRISDEGRRKSYACSHAGGTTPTFVTPLSSGVMKVFRSSMATR
jgi:hypothetical protein